MSFWNNFNNNTAQKSKFAKPEIVKPDDLMEFVSKDSFAVEDWSRTRFFGPVYGTSTINVPIIRDGKFYKKPTGGSRLICIPKKSLGFNFQTGQLDETKCPYLQHITLDNPLIKTAVLNYLEESNVKDKETAIDYIEKEGLKKAYWNKDIKKIISLSTELSSMLQNISSRGLKEFYTNVFVVDKAKPLTTELKARFKDLAVRRSSEQTPKADTLGYSDTYKTQLYFAEDKNSASLTPLKVLRLSESNMNNIYSMVVKLNTVITENPDGSEREEVRAVEHPEEGCEVRIQRKPSQLKSFTGNPVFTLEFGKGDRRPLVEEQKLWMLWDLTKLGSTESYDDAEAFLRDLKYTTDVTLDHVVTVPFDKPKTHLEDKPAIKSPAFTAPVFATTTIEEDQDPFEATSTSSTTAGTTEDTNEFPF